MKKIILTFIILLVGLISYNNIRRPPQHSNIIYYETVKNNTEKCIKYLLSNPEGYEFVGLKLIDSVLYIENINYHKDKYIQYIEDKEKILDKQERYKHNIPFLYNIYKVKRIKNDIKVYEQILNNITVIETELKEVMDKVTSYTFIFTFRTNNIFILKTLYTYIIQTGPAPEYEILNITDNTDKLYLNSINFPEYDKMILKYY